MKYAIYLHILLRICTISDLVSVNNRELAIDPRVDIVATVSPLEYKRKKKKAKPTKTLMTIITSEQE